MTATRALAASVARERLVRAAGLIISCTGCAALLWLFVQQPTNLQELTGGVAASVGAYQINQAEFDALKARALA